MLEVEMLEDSDNYLYGLDYQSIHINPYYDLNEYENLSKNLSMDEKNDEKTSEEKRNKSVNNSPRKSAVQKEKVTEVNVEFPKQWEEKKTQVKTLNSEFTVKAWLPNKKKLNKNSTDKTTMIEVVKLPVSEFKFEKNDVNENKQKPFACGSCKKMFRNQSERRKHYITHGPRSFVCNECNKSFVESSKLKRHQMVHTGERPFKCSFPNCDRSFSLKFNMKTHLRIHTNLRPYVCHFEGCNKSFIQSTNLKAHIKKHGPYNGI